MLAKQLRDAYATGPAAKEEVSSFFDECLSPLRRADTSADIRNGKTTFGCHPTDPRKLVRVNPDRTRDSGTWTESGFQPD